jgi:hypothetical protein
MGLNSGLKGLRNSACNWTAFALRKLQKIFVSCHQNAVVNKFLENVSKFNICRIGMNYEAQVRKLSRRHTRKSAFVEVNLKVNLRLTMPV